MSRDFDVVIVGAGVVGSVMAGLLIARQIIEPGGVAVITDRQPVMGPAADWDLRVFALSRASQRVLEACGAWAGVDPLRRHAYERMTVWAAEGTAGGAGSLTFDSAELGEPNLGWIVEGRALQIECLNAANAAGVVFIEATISDIVVADGGCRVGLTDGREIRGRLLIGADGMESRTRALLGIETGGHAYHQQGLVAHVRTEKHHRNVAYQRFLRTGPLAFLPLPGGRSSIVWSATQAEARRLAALDRVELGRAVTIASDGVLGACEVDSEIVSFPLKLASALEYVRPGAALIGDAAHVVHPLAGQGLNLGLLDCASLSEVMTPSRAGLESPADFRALRRYERWRRSENQMAAAALDGLERLFASGSPLAALSRTRGLDVVGGLPFLKRELARRALGLAGDVPAMVRTDARRVFNPAGDQPSRRR